MMNRFPIMPAVMFVAENSIMDDKTSRCLVNEIPPQQRFSTTISNMESRNTIQVRIALDVMQVNFESGRNQLLAVTLPRLRRLIRTQQRTFPQMKGKSDNAESLVLEKLSRALEADLRPKTALHFWNLSAKITRQVLIDLTRTPTVVSRLGMCSISEEFSALEPASETNNPVKLAELTELHLLIASVGERLSGIDSEMLNLRFYTELSFPEIAELLEVTLDTVRYHWRLIRLELAAKWIELHGDKVVAWPGE